MARWFVNRPHDNGCVYYRHTLPLRHLMPLLARQGVRVTYSSVLDLRVEYDAYFFARWVNPEYLPFVADLKDRGRVLVWDLDDDLLGLDRFNADELPRASLSVNTLQFCLDMADVITVSTEPLREVVGRPRKTVVCPNLIDLDHYPIQPRNERGPILYAGSPSHAQDIELVRDLHAKTRRRTDWVWYGIKPSFLSRRDTWIPWSRVVDYPRLCRMVRPSVALAPLVRDRFNGCKSPIKVWECATLGASVIASDVGPYMGSAAALVDEGPFRIEHLESVMERPNHAACLAEARHNSWQHTPHGGMWLAMYMHVLSLCT